MLHSLLKLIPHGVTGKDYNIADLFSLANQENKLHDIIEDFDLLSIEPEGRTLPRCDPYYDDCDDREQSDWREVWGYEKEDVHLMTWMALFQTAMPTLIFSELEQAAYKDHFGSAKTDSSEETRAHYTP